MIFIRFSSVVDRAAPFGLTSVDLVPVAIGIVISPDILQHYCFVLGNLLTSCIVRGLCCIELVLMLMLELVLILELVLVLILELGLVLVLEPGPVLGLELVLEIILEPEPGPELEPRLEPKLKLRPKPIDHNIHSNFDLSNMKHHFH